MSMTAEQAYILGKKYVEESFVGGGAVKGKNCTIQSIEDIDATTHKVIFRWILDDGTVKDNFMTVKDGITPTIEVKENTDKKYILHIKIGDIEFDTPNLKGEKGENGADGATGSSGRFDVNSLTREDIIKLRELLNITSELPDIEEPQTTFVTFEFADNGDSTDELYVTFEGVEPNMSIEDDGNLYLDYEGAEPNMYIDEDGNMILED